jgi:hypothetical protein
MEHDLDFCMNIDGSTNIPCVTSKEDETGLLVLDAIKM